MNKTAGEKIRLSLIVITVLCVLIIGSSTYLLTLIKSNDNICNNIARDAEQTWRVTTHSYLDKLRTDLETAVSKNEINPYDNGALKTWIVKNADVLYMHINMDNFGLFAIGYSFDKDSINLDVAFNDSSIDDQNIRNDITKRMDTVISNLTNKSNEEIIANINTISEGISKDYNNIIPKELIKDNLIKNISHKNSVIFSTNSDIGLLTNEQQSYTITNDNGEVIWVESIVVPDGALGFNQQPKYVNDKENLSYKKLSIVISTKADDVLNVYNSTLKEYNRMVGILLFGLTIIILSSIGSLAISFKNLLKLNRMGGGIDAIEDGRDSNSGSNI